MPVRSSIFLVLITLTAHHGVHGQASASWQRVYTGDDSVIDINASSLRLESGRVIKAEFRTTLSQPENTGRGNRPKYKTRIETIRFKSNEARFQLGDTNWLDPKDVTIQTHVATGEEEWRVIKPGGMTERLAYAAIRLAPFGRWRITSHRSLDENFAKTVMKTLIGSRVYLYPDSAQIGSKMCASIGYEDKGVSSAEFEKQFEVRLASLGVDSGFVETTSMTCEGQGWTTPKSLLLRLRSEEMLMLWEGVFVVLEREKVWTGKLLPPYTRTKQ